MNIYYCPNGHNVFDTNATYEQDEGPQCAACGRTMTLDDSGFYQVLEEIEERGIAKAERELKKEEEQ